MNRSALYRLAVSSSLLGMSLLAGIAQASPASAREEQALKARFAQADADHDGKLTLAEAQAGMPVVAKVFAKIDTTSKGYVTVEDIEAAAKSGALRVSAAAAAAKASAAGRVASAASQG